MSIKCSICENLELQKIELPSRDGEIINLLKCTNCNHIFQHPDNYKDLYTTGEFTKIARNNQKNPSKQKIYELDKKALERIRFYYKFLGVEFDNILEIGSSIGSFVHHLRLMGKDARGLEPDPDYANFSNLQYGFKQYCSTLEEFCVDKKFDAICSFHVLEHIQDLNIFLSKVNDLLNLNGKLLFELPSLDIHNYGELKKTIWKPHIQYFSISSLYFLFSKYFKVLKIGYYGESLFVFANKTIDIKLDKKQFKKLGFRYKRVYTLINILPKIKIKRVKIIQLFLQPFLQKDFGQWLQKIFFFITYGIKERIYVFKERKIVNPKKITHITYYRGWENTGDTVLSKCVRDVFNNSLKINWTLRKIVHPVNEQLINQINKSKIVLLGGGGVLIPDTNVNSVSGWQWAISKSQLDQIKTPIIIYAIGYNYFPNQIPNKFFIENLKYIVEKSEFIGLRNNGSIKKVSELVGDGLKSKLVFQPCPTTIIRNLYNGLPTKKLTKNIGVNIAFDRYEKRFGKDIYKILDQISLALKDIGNKGYNIYNICHLNSDSKFELTLNKNKVNYKTVYLNYKLPYEVYDFYNSMELVMGMRGHAQMIPFGLNCRIISLGSHNKIKWFLEDIDALDWFIDIRQDINSLRKIILDKFDSIINNPSIPDELIKKQNYLYEMTVNNLKLIKNIINER